LRDGAAVVEHDASAKEAAGMDGKKIIESDLLAG